MWQNFFFIANYSSFETDLKFPNGSGALLTMWAMFYEYYFLRGIETHRTVFVSHTEFCILFIGRTRVVQFHRSTIRAFFFQFIAKTSFYENLNKKEYSFYRFNKLKIERETEKKQIPISYALLTYE